MPSMKDKVIIVTGSSSGIGFATLQHLTRMGAKVYMAVPDEEQTRMAIQRLKDEGLESQVTWHELDLKNAQSAKSSAERFIEKEEQLDVLVNNAAMISDQGHPTMNVDGIQNNMAINYLGPFVFTQTLLPLLEKTASKGRDARIVNVGSAGCKDVTYLQFGSKEAWNNKFRFSLLPPLSRYKYSKLAVHLWTNHLAKRLSSDGSRVMILIVQPGAILSDGAKRNLQSLPFPSFWVWLLGTMMDPQERGAYTSVFAACAPRDDPNIRHGVYISPPNVAEEQPKPALDERAQTELFEFTKQLLDDIGVGVGL
ncbi:hypothetical protein VNI00_006556 [Paramarasmius palmivorus]|uniref:NAD(P)-binding protein n=1 Tax=Paramarasmius palmivorus TaxID=297713 RepID=A0AAW0D949_9AGAR